MIELWHGFCFGAGFAVTLASWMLLDKFTSDVLWRFWEWKRKNFKGRG